MLEGYCPWFKLLVCRPGWALIHATALGKLPMSMRNRPGMNYLTRYRYGRAGKTAMASNEMNSKEKPTTGATDTYTWLPGHTGSPAAHLDIASNETSPRS